MRAAIVHEAGTSPVLGDFEEPQDHDGHEVAEVVVAGLNPVDLYIAAGQYGPVEPPFVVGLEGIARVSGGRRVYFNGVPRPFGSMAQAAPIDPATSFDVPDGLDAGLAVALGIAGLAGWLPLEARAELRAYERMAGHAAAGELRVEVEELPLSRIEDAWRAQASGPHHKIVLIP